MQKRSPIHTLANSKCKQSQDASKETHHAKGVNQKTYVFQHIKISHTHTIHGHTHTDFECAQASAAATRAEADSRDQKGCQGEIGIPAIVAQPKAVYQAVM